MRRVTLTRDDLAQVLAERFDPQGYGGAIVAIPTPGGLMLEWTCDWTATDDDTLSPEHTNEGS